MKRYFIGLAAVFILFFFLKFGRTVYMPFMNKLKGAKTIESIIIKKQNEVWGRLETNLVLAGYKMDFPKEIILVAIKEDQVLKVYSKDYTGIKLIKTYPFTAYSGKLGPKLKEGDKQIPEGIYEVESLNPNSSYHLSIKINYPNKFDKSKTRHSDLNDLGGDIFIHGKSATIGCIPIGDEAIEEVFVLTEKARANKVKVIISPRDFLKNSEYPKIDEIDWEGELYDIIKTELELLNELELLTKSKFDFFNTPVPENAISILVKENDLLELESESLKFENLCAKISSSLKLNRSINLKNEGRASFKFYKKVYTELSNCISKTREEISYFNFSKSFEELSKSEKEKMIDMFNVAIVENLPE